MEEESGLAVALGGKVGEVVAGDKGWVESEILDEG